MVHYVTPETPEKVKELAEAYLERGAILSFFRLLGNIKNSSKLASGITPKIINLAAQDSRKRLSITDFTGLLSVSADLDSNLLQACLPEFEIIHIPRSTETHDFNLTFSFHRESGDMTLYGRCSKTSSLEKLKQRWNWHPIAERRERSLPFVVGVFQDLAAERVPETATQSIIENPEQVAASAATQLRSAGYEAPAFKA